MSLTVIEGNFATEEEVEVVQLSCSACGFPHFSWSFAEHESFETGCVHTLRCTGCGEYHVFGGDRLDLTDVDV